MDMRLAVAAGGMSGFQTQFLPLNNPTALVICEGDSITEGVGAPLGESYPDQLAALLGEDFSVINSGTSGETCHYMATVDATTQIDSAFIGGIPNFAILRAGINDLRIIPATPAETHADIASWCAGRKARGYIVIVMTLTPSIYAGDAPNINDLRNQVNVLIRANWESYADEMADIGGDATIGDDGDAANGTYYSDGLHMTSAGYAIVASYAHAAIVSLLPT